MELLGVTSCAHMSSVPFDMQSQPAILPTEEVGRELGDRALGTIRAQNEGSRLSTKYVPSFFLPCCFNSLDGGGACVAGVQAVYQVMVANAE